MKKITSLFLGVICCTTAFSQTLQGSIKNATKETSLTVKTISERTLKEIEIKNGSFATKDLGLEEGYYLLRKGNEAASIYLKPTDELIINFDAKDFKNTLLFLGKGAEANNFLVAKRKLESDRREDTDAFYGGTEADYLKKIKGIATDTKTLLSKINDVSFKEAELEDLKYSYLFDIYNYPNLLKYYFGKEVTPSKDFLQPLENINYDNAELYVKYPSYKNLASVKWKKDIEKAESYEEMERIFRKIRTRHLYVDVIINSYYRISDAKGKAKFHYQLIKKFVPSHEFVSEAKQAYDKVKATAKGNKSPNFNYEDKDGKKVSLSDFKGKYVFIDVWATWCTPCLKQVPYLKKLEEKYHDKNIVFIGISVDKKEQYDAWKKLLVEKKMKGIQLFADNSFDSDFIDAYGISSIPRFLLIAPDGTIVDNHFSKPSHKKTEKLLDKLLN